VNTQFYLQAGCPSCCPTTSVRALTAKALKEMTTLTFVKWFLINDDDDDDDE